ncbi:MAG: general stress protein [Chloroflexota bacterium]|nr:general stress protein [Chloroflexota bacterium]
MTMSQRTTVAGVFTEREQVQRAIHELQQAGFRDDQIGFMVRDDTPSQEESQEAHSGEVEAETEKRTVTGAVIGSLIGAAVIFLIPGLGPALAGGILAAGIGASAGGLLGRLTTMGLPEEEAHYYHQELEAGRVIVTVQAGERSQEALEILHHNGAYNAYTQVTPSEAITTVAAHDVMTSSETAAPNMPQPAMPPPQDTPIAPSGQVTEQAPPPGAHADQNV